MKKSKWKIITALFIGILIGFIIGEQYQMYRELDWCVSTGLKMMTLKGIDVDINKAAIITGIMLYKHKIDNFLGRIK